MTNPTVHEFAFPWPNAEKGYSLFSSNLEDNPLVLFHGTLKSNLEPILREGFRPTGSLESTSYAKRSVTSLNHLMTNRGTEEYVVIAVQFTAADLQNLAQDTSVVYVCNHDLQPTILGYVTIPTDYEHR